MKNPIVNCILFLLVSCSSFSQSNKDSLIFFEGLYETVCEYDKDYNDTIGDQYYLRFYPNGKVIGVGTDCSGSVEDLKSWLYIDNTNSSNMGKGDYTIKKRKIKFTLYEEFVTLHYKGKVLKDGSLQLKWKNLNGTGHEVYKFIPIEELK